MTVKKAIAVGSKVPRFVPQAVISVFLTDTQLSPFQCPYFLISGSRADLNMESLSQASHENHCVRPPGSVTLTVWKEKKILLDGNMINLCAEMKTN